MEEPNGAGGWLIFKMTMRRQHFKLFLMAGFLSGALGALGYRLVDLQVVHHEDYQKLAQKNTVRTNILRPMRGQILDIHGNPLALSQPAKVICADPSPAMMSNYYPIVARALAPLLQTNEAFLLERLKPRMYVENGKTNPSKYVVLKRKVPQDTWDKIRQTMAGLSFGVNESNLPSRQKNFFNNLRRYAIFPEDDQIRYYPGQRLAAHVVGFVDNNDEENGLSGIECSYNADLAGAPGWRKTEIDKRQRELVPYRDQDVPPRDGLNVVLTIDAGLQDIVESELAAGMKEHEPISVSCIMVRPRTGEILAMATLPNFDPNFPGAFPMEALRNRVIADLEEPGSTFKIVVVTGALNEGALTLNDRFDCGMGHFLYAGRMLHDHAPYGDLTALEIITKSSNIGAAKIAIACLGKEKLWQYIHNFGFGEKTGIPLPWERDGIVHPTTNWSAVSIAQIPMGQGVAVTPLQMVMAMSAIANHGVLMRPMLVNRLEEPGGKIAVQYAPEPVRRVAGEEAIRQIIQALKTVPTKEGTAVAAHMDRYTVAGKTGTAQKVDHGKYVQRFYTSFIGFFPADNPELCISVAMDEPKDKNLEGRKVGHFGGVIDGPIFHNIAERAAKYLNLKPDIAPTPSEAQNLTAASTAAHQ
jgi:cell division protein FtsI/penicillin-binding protein 2